MVPKLRFPEFREAGEWKEKPLNQVSPSIFDGTHQTPKYTEDGVPFFSVENIVSGNKNKFISYEDHIAATRKNKPERGDILVTRIGIIGYSVVVDWDYEFSIYVTLAVVKKSPSANSYFLHCYFQSNRYQKEILGKSLLNAVPCKINMEELRKTDVLLPKIEEQQKIADCLSSLDELIAAQTLKLDALKTHKKGLMQQLFPAEGETVPKLRFPEFHDAPEWELRELGKSLLAHPDYGLNAPAVPYSEELPTYLRITDISEDGYYLRNQMVSVEISATAENYLNEGEIVLARTGASVGKSYKYRKQDGKLVFAGFLIRVKPDTKKINPDLLFHFLSTEQYWKWVAVTSARSGQPGINGNEYALLPVPLPSSPNEEQNLAEQQRIADSLNSIDELIAAQTLKLDALKTHKKGLMQQLFPAVDDDCMDAGGRATQDAEAEAQG